MLQHTGSEVKNAEKVGLRLWGVALGMNHTASGSAPSRVRHSVSEWPLGVVCVEQHVECQRRTERWR